MVDGMKNAGAIVVICLALAIGVSCSVMRWNDCRKVGHAWWYCMSEMNR